MNTNEIEECFVVEEWLYNKQLNKKSNNKETPTQHTTPQIPLDSITIAWIFFRYRFPFIWNTI